MPPSARRTPTTTATSAMPSVAASSSTAPDRKATRSVPIVARRYSSLTSRDALRLRAPRLNARSVGRPRTTSRKWPDEERQRLPALSSAALGVAPDEPHEQRDERQRQQHHARGEEVDRGDEREHRDRHDDREHDLREVTGEGRLERVHARRRPRSRPPRSARRRAQPAGSAAAVSTRSSRSCGEHVRRRPTPATSKPQAATRTRDDDGAEDDERRRHIGERSAVERARGDAREQHRLREHEQRHDDAERGVGGEQHSRRPAHGGGDAGRGTAPEVRYEGSGRSPMPVGGRRSTSSPGRAGRAERRSSATTVITLSA